MLRSLPFPFPVAIAPPNPPTPNLPTVQRRRFVYNHGHVVAVDNVVSVSSTRLLINMKGERVFCSSPELDLPTNSCSNARLGGRYGYICFLNPSV